MAGAGNGQKFGDAFDDAKQDNVDQISQEKQAFDEAARPQTRQPSLGASASRNLLRHGRYRAISLAERVLRCAKVRGIRPAKPSLRRLRHRCSGGNFNTGPGMQAQRPKAK